MSTPARIELNHPAIWLTYEKQATDVRIKTIVQPSVFRKNHFTLKDSETRRRRISLQWEHMLLF
jgi:hypothetical protein